MCQTGLSSYLFFALFVVSSAFFSQEVAAQSGWVNDPYKKPEVWSKLKKNPHDSVAWAEYNGSGWQDLSHQEQLTIKLWMQSLWREKLASGEELPQEPEPEEAPKVPEKDDRFKELLKKPKVVRFLNDLQEVMLAEPEEMDELKMNVFENFLIIEEYFSEAFEEYGEAYVSFAETYPDGGGSEIQWVEAQEKKLRKLKTQKLNELKWQFLEQQVKKENTP